MIIIQYLISFLLGLLLLNYCLKEDKISGLLFVTLAFCLGLGISSMVSFLSFVMTSSFNKPLSFILNLSLLLYLFTLSVRNLNKRQSLKAIFNLPQFNIVNILIILFWIATSYGIYLVAKYQAYGEWDAWALWNLKTKFLVLMPHDWKVIFTKLSWHTQPDYPLLLPFINVWIHLFSKEYLPIIPFITSYIFTLSCSLLLFAGLSQFIKKEIALIPACLILCNPFFVFLATAQYADILLAFYLLASFITITLSLINKSRNLSFISGLILGLLSFTKNEGIVMTILLFALTLLYVITDKSLQSLKKQILTNLIFGLALTASITIFFKLFIAPPNRDILTNLSAEKLSYLNLDGIKIIAQAIFKELVHKRWSFISYLILLMFLANPRKFFFKECKIFSTFLLFYLLTVIIIYLTTTNFDLAWRLKNTLARIYFYLLPSIMFLGFYVHWRKNES